MQAGSTPVAYYLYNGLGQRVVKTVGSNARVYLYDLNGLLISEIDLARNTHIEYVYLDGRPLAQITPRPDLWDTELEHILIDVNDPNQTATVSLDTDTQTLEFSLSGGGGQTYLNPPVWDETHFDNQRYLAIEDPQTGASTGYAVEYSLYLYEDNVQAVLHLTPKAGGTERVFMLETSTTEMPPIAYYHTDHLGTPKALTDSAQTVVWWAEYEPFGKANITTGNNLRFPGQYFDSETGLSYNGFRYFDPRIGGYTQADSVGVVPGVASTSGAGLPSADMRRLRSIPLQLRLMGGLNHLYGYVAANPLRGIDPFGLTMMVFDPMSGNLTVDPEAPGRSPYTVPASSGRPNCDCDSSAKNKGPIPSGIYDIKSNEVSDPPWYKDITRNMSGDWGDWRAYLQPCAGTNTYGRSGFFMHGGSRKGSAGCIDVGGGRFGNSMTDQILNDIMNDPDGSVPVTVK